MKTRCVQVAKRGVLIYPTYYPRNEQTSTSICMPHKCRVYIPQHVNSVCAALAVCVRSPIFQSHSMMALWHGRSKISEAASCERVSVSRQQPTNDNEKFGFFVCFFCEWGRWWLKIIIFDTNFTVNWTKFNRAEIYGRAERHGVLCDGERERVHRTVQHKTRHSLRDAAGA